MKKEYLFIFVLLLVACSDKDEVSSKEMNTDLLLGEWVSDGQSKEYFTEFSLWGSSKAEMKIIKNTLSEESVFTEDKGNWTYYSSNNVLRFQMFYSVLSDFEIQELNSDYLKMRNKKQNWPEMFYHIIDKNELLEANQSNINNISLFGGNLIIESSNDSIASISKDGIISGKKKGIAFIKLNSPEKTAYVKVTVKNRVEEYSKEVQLTIDDILAKYGNPDVEGVVDEKFDGAYYKESLFDPKMYAIQYDYNKNTRKVARINCIYKDNFVYTSDVSFVENNYFLLNTGMYGKYEDEFFVDNKYFVSPFINNAKQMRINIYNANFFD